MSNEPHRRYLLGILQRGARPVGQGNRVNRSFAGQVALEQSETLIYPRAPAGIDTPNKSSAPAGFSETTPSLNQINQPADLQTTHSGPLAPTKTADPLLETATATVTRSGETSQFDFQSGNSPSDELSPFVAVAVSESDATVRFDGAQPSLNPEQTVTTTPSLSFSPADRQPVDSPSDHVKLATAVSIRESLDGESFDRVSVERHLFVRDPVDRDPSDRAGPETASQSLSQTYQTDSSQPSAAESGSAVLPITDTAQTKINSTLTGTNVSKPRLPRLVVLEQGSKTICSDNSSVGADDIEPGEKPRATLVREENRDALDSQRFADLRTEEHGPSRAPLQSSQAPTVRSFVKFEMNQTPDNRIFIRKTSADGETQVQSHSATILHVDHDASIEPVRTLHTRELQAADNLRPQQNAGPSEFARQESSERPLAAASGNVQETRVAQFRFPVFGVKRGRFENQARTSPD